MYLCMEQQKQNIMTKTRNWNELSQTGRYLTAQDTLNDEGYYAEVKGTVQAGLTLSIGSVTRFELMDIKARFPYISIVE